MLAGQCWVRGLPLQEAQVAVKVGQTRRVLQFSPEGIRSLQRFSGCIEVVLQPVDVAQVSPEVGETGSVCTLLEQLLSPGSVREGGPRIPQGGQGNCQVMVQVPQPAAIPLRPAGQSAPEVGQGAAELPQAPAGEADQVQDARPLPAQIGRKWADNGLALTPRLPGKSQATLPVAPVPGQAGQLVAGFRGSEAVPQFSELCNWATRPEGWPRARTITSSRQCAQELYNPHWRSDWCRPNAICAARDQVALKRDARSIVCRA